MTDVASRQASNMPKLPRTPSNSGAARKTPKVSDTGKSQNFEKSETGDTKARNNGGDPFTQHDLESVAEDQSIGNATNDGLEELSEDEDGTEVIPAGSVDNQGDVITTEGTKIGRVNGGATSELEGSLVDQEGDILDAEGNIIGTADLLQHASRSAAGDKPPLEAQAPFGVQDNGDITNATGSVVGRLAEGKPQDLVGTAITSIDASGNMKAESGSTIGKAELQDKLLKETISQNPDAAVKEAEPSDKADNAIDLQENEGANTEVTTNQKPIPNVDPEDEDLKPDDSASKVSGSKAPHTSGVAGESGAAKEVHSRVDGVTAAPDLTEEPERLDELDPKPIDDNELVKETPHFPDLSILKDMKVNKLGKVVDENGTPFGQLVEGEATKVAGRRVDGEGQIWNDKGVVIGRAELLPEADHVADPSAPFEDFPDAIVEKSGSIVSGGKVVGKLVEGDAKKLENKKVDADGDILDRNGNSLGRAERWTEEDAPEPEKIDFSILAGTRVNKLGNLVDSHGRIFGRVVDGELKTLVGRLCDKNGVIWNDGGKVIGRAELVSDSERDGQKEGPFTGFDFPTINKDGKVVDSKGTIIGRLIDGDSRRLCGRQVDADGEIIDGNGNSLGKAERWDEVEKPKVCSPVEGRRVNREGCVVDENGDLIAKLTEGEITKCSGMEIDADGDVHNSKNQVIGHVTLLDQIPAEPEPEPEAVEEEPKESQEDIDAKKQIEQDTKLASRMAFSIQESIDKISPILKNITDEIDTVDRQQEADRDEQKLVDKVKPLIEEGGRILTETNGIIRGMDPDGRITANAKQKSATREATPEEHHLAELLKELTGNVTQTIEKAKKKIAGMPHAKKELNPLWGLLAEPLGQILAAVGLLLSGVLGLVGRLLSGLGLGGLLDNLLGGLGIKGILKGLGLGMVTESLTGRK